MTEQEWRPVVAYAGQYEVSDAGRIRSITRLKPYRDDVRVARGRIISPTAVSGYPRVLLWKDGKSKSVFVHRLVAEAFHGLPPSPRHQVNHKNGNRADPRATNLEWVTASENQVHAYQELGRKPSRNVVSGEANGRAKLSDAAVEKMRHMHASGATYADLAEGFGVHPATVSRVVRQVSRAGSPQ